MIAANLGSALAFLYCSGYKQQGNEKSYLRYNLPKLGNSSNAKSDTKSDTNTTAWKKKSPLESGFVNNAELWI